MADDFEDVIALAKRIVEVHQKIANDMFPNGVTLRCDGCGFSRDYSPEQAARFLGIGWPKHHGITMSVKARPPAASPAPQDRETP